MEEVFQEIRRKMGKLWIKGTKFRASELLDKCLPIGKTKEKEMKNRLK
jgi:hypothetical protein